MLRDFILIYVDSRLQVCEFELWMTSLDVGVLAVPNAVLSVRLKLLSVWVRYKVREILIPRPVMKE